MSKFIFLMLALLLPSCATMPTISSEKMESISCRKIYRSTLEETIEASKKILLLMEPTGVSINQDGLNLSMLRYTTGGIGVFNSDTRYLYEFSFKKDDQDVLTCIKISRFISGYMHYANKLTWTHSEPYDILFGRINTLLRGGQWSTCKDVILMVGSEASLDPICHQATDAVPSTGVSLSKSGNETLSIQNYFGRKY